MLNENITSSGLIFSSFENLAIFLILKIIQDLLSGILTLSAIRPYWLKGSSNEDFISVSNRYVVCQAATPFNIYGFRLSNVPIEASFIVPP